MLKSANLTRLTASHRRRRIWDSDCHSFPLRRGVVSLDDLCGGFYVFAYAFGSPLNDIHACGSRLNDISACGSPLNDWTLVVGGPSGGVDTGKWRYKVPRLLWLAFVLRIPLHIGNRLSDPILRIQKDFPLMC